MDKPSPVLLMFVLHLKIMKSVISVSVGNLRIRNKQTHNKYIFETEVFAAVNTSNTQLNSRCIKKKENKSNPNKFY